MSTLAHQSQNLSNRLVQDSPALVKHLRRLWTDEALLSDLAAIYGQVVSIIGTEDSYIVRPAGASFNPKPARLCQIILAETEITDATVLGAALLSCLPAPLPLCSHFARCCEDTASSARKLRAGTMALPVKSLEAEIIFLAHQLDRLRHLHMSSIAADAQRNFIFTLQREIIPNIRHPQSARLKNLLQAGVDRWLLKHNT